VRIHKLFAETIGVSGIAELTAGLFYIADDTIGFSDAFSKAISSVYGETLTLDDQVSFVSTIIKILPEIIYISEEETNSIYTALTEALEINDTLVKSGIFSYSDAIAIEDNLSSLVAKQLVETVLLSDAISKNSNISKSEALEIAGSFTKAITISRSFVDDFTLSDDYSKNIFKTLSDTLSLDDQVAIVLTMVRILGEEIGLSDGDIAAISIIMSEQMELASALAFAISKKSFAENMSFSDVASFSIALAIAEALGISDDIAKSIVLTNVETLAFDDAFTFGSILCKVFTEVLSLSASFAFPRELTLDETMAMADVLVTAIGLVKSENIAINDSNVFAIARTLVDTIVLSGRAGMGMYDYNPENNILISILKASLAVYKG